MHAALAAPTDDPRFTVEPIGRAEREALARTTRSALDEVRGAARSREGLPEDVRARFEALGRSARGLDAIVERFVEVERCAKTRVHGDLHLGQVLVTGGDFVLLDFEGEPARPLSVRKAKRSPLVDVAGMVRSLDYAAVTAEAGERVFSRARDEFLEAYFAAATSSVFPSRADRDALLCFYLFEKCVYELRYELDNRPAWAAIPLLGMERLLEAACARVA
jgi:trehalose synthase-fused probable maltokinase